MGLRAANGAIGRAVLDDLAVRRQAAERAAAWPQRRPFGPREPAEGVVQRFRREPQFQPRQRIAQPLCQHHLPVVAALGGGGLAARRERRYTLSTGWQTDLAEAGGWSILQARVSRATSRFH
jgi:hypothetical protein